LRGLTGAVGGGEVVSRRWRWVFSATLERRRGRRGFGSPRTGMAGAAICGDVIAGKLELWRERTGEYVWEVE
jgi:hypothetical protein